MTVKCHGTFSMESLYTTLLFFVEVIMDLAAIIKEKMDALNHVGEKVAPKLNQLFLTSLEKSLSDFYGSYDPKMYHRTNNFRGVQNTGKTFGNGNSILFIADSSSMAYYPGIYSPLSSDAGFDMMFMNGEHGHGRFYATSSTPPYEIVDTLIQSKFNGQADVIINEAVGEIIKL